MKEVNYRLYKEFIKQGKASIGGNFMRLLDEQIAAFEPSSASINNCK